MAYDFVAASSQGILYGDNLSISPTLTIACWFRPDSVASNMVIAGKHDESTGAREYRIGHQSSKIQAFYSNDGTFISNNNVSGATTLVNGTVYHALAILDAANTTITIYLDGSEDVSKTTTTGTTIHSGAAEFAIGGTHGPGNPNNMGNEFDGDVWEVAIWNRALLAAERTLLAAGYSSLFIPNGLQAYFPIVRDINDRWSLGLTGTLAGTPSVSPHGRIIMPAQMPFAHVTAGAPPGNAMPMAMNHYRRRRAG